MPRSTPLSDEEIGQKKKEWQRIALDKEALTEALTEFGPEGMARIKGYQDLVQLVRTIAKENGLLELISRNKPGGEQK